MSLSFFNTTSKASTPIVLEDEQADYFLEREHIDILKDSTGNLTIQDISSSALNTSFKTLTSKYPTNEDPGTSYWIRFKVKDKTKDIQWLLECYNIQANIIELYIPQGNETFKIVKAGANYKFEDRTLNHINFEFLLPELNQNEKTFYLKFISKNGESLRFLIRSYVRFSNYAFSEYYLLGLFYGMIIIISIYNLFLYPRLKDVAYLYYAIYALFVGLFSMAQDGMGFQFIWSEYPQFNSYAPFLFSTLMVISMLLYTKSFLETKAFYPSLNKIINGFIIIRLFILLFQVLFLPELSSSIWIDLFPFIIAYITSIVAYKNNNRGAIYFVIGFSILFISFLINTLRIVKILQPNIITVYAINIGSIIEMVLLSQALSERVKKIKESEILKETLNRELEQKVKERTEALSIQKNIIEEKVKTLDTFIYKASHDIKGPLKSLIGVATLGMKDTPDNAPIYFNHALKTAHKLDAIVKDLLHITQINNSKLNLVEISFKDIIIDILETFNNLPGYEKMKFEIDIQQENSFYSEKVLIYSIFQNFIENAIKYRDPEAKTNKLKIHLKENSGLLEIKFMDNGIGIQEEYFDKIFEMFFKISEQSDDSTGLGLYIVKLAIERLEGQVFVQSKLGEETTFTVILKNKVPETIDTI